jgi:hypothetical protein
MGFSPYIKPPDLDGALAAEAFSLSKCHYGMKASPTRYHQSCYGEQERALGSAPPAHAISTWQKRIGLPG